MAYKEWEILEHSVLNWMSLSNPFPQGSWIHVQEKAERLSDLEFIEYCQLKERKTIFLLSNSPTLSKESKYLVSYLYNSETQKVILMNVLLYGKCKYKCSLEKSIIKSDKNLMI